MRREGCCREDITFIGCYFYLVNGVLFVYGHLYMDICKIVENLFSEAALISAASLFMLLDFSEKTFKLRNISQGAILINKKRSDHQTEKGVRE